MIELKTQEDVLSHARVVFETTPLLVDLAMALGDPRRTCVITGPKNGVCKVEWPVNAGVYFKTEFISTPSGPVSRGCGDEPTD